MSQIKLDELRLHAPNVDIQPSKGWRELAKRGVRSASYKVFARAFLPNGEQVAVDLRLPALNADRVFADIGTEEVPFVASLLAKQDANIDSAILATDPLGEPVIENGAPVYAEPAIVQDDGAEFDLAYGTLWFCTVHGGVRLTLKGVTLTPTGRSTQGEKPLAVYSAEAASHEVTKVAAASGPALLGRVKIGGTNPQAARANAAARAVPVAM